MIIHPRLFALHNVSALNSMQIQKGLTDGFVPILYSYRLTHAIVKRGFHYELLFQFRVKYLKGGIKDNDK